MSIYDDIAGVAAVTIPQGAVKKITRKADGGLIWEKPVLGDPVLNNNDWATIRAVSDAGQAANIWNVGDRKGVVLDGKVSDGLTFGNYTSYCCIIGFDHNSSREGTNRIHFMFGHSALSGGKQIAFVDSSYYKTMTSGSWLNIYNTNNNSGGWYSSLMRTNIMPAFKNAMPSDLQSVLKTVTKYSDNTGGGRDTSSYVTATTETVFLLAEYEVTGVRKYANSAEQNYQAQYAYYSAGNRIGRYQHSSIQYVADWWLRSAYSYASYGFCSATDEGGNGGVKYLSVAYSFGIAPAFCV